MPLQGSGRPQASELLQETWAPATRLAVGAVAWFVVGGFAFKRFEVGIADVA